MKKRKAMLVLGTLAVCAAFLGACKSRPDVGGGEGNGGGGENDPPVIPPHTHVWSDWRYNETEHWKECSCGERSEEGAHSFSDGITCNVCGYEEEIEEGDLLFKPVYDNLWSLDGKIVSYEVAGTVDGVMPGEVTVPATYRRKPVTGIAPNAFLADEESPNDSLVSVVLPDSVTKIGDFAFAYCTALKTIEWGGTAEIGKQAFYAAGLEEFEIPASVEKMGDNAFYGSAAKTVTINGTIGTGAFRSCVSLGSVTFGVNAPSVAESSFRDCVSLTAVDLGSVTRIRFAAFKGCSALASVTVPESVKTVGTTIFEDCISLKEVVWNAVGCNSEISDETFDKVLAVASNFKNCKNLTVRVGTGATVVRELFKGVSVAALTVGEDAILQQECFLQSSVQTVTFGKNIHIGVEAFSNCDSLTEVSIPDGAILGRSSFYWCTNLSSITLADGIERIDGCVFFNTAHYKNKGNWENNDGGGTLYYVGKYLLASQVGAYDKDNAVRIKEGTRMIVSGSLAGSSLYVPSSVVYIGEAPADIGGYLKSITVNSANPYYYSEGNCLIERATGKLLLGGYESTIPSTVTAIGDRAFYYMGSIKTMLNWEITIPSSVKTIGNEAFKYSKFVGITLSEGLESVGTSAFAYCKRLTQITVPSSVNYIGENAFEGCSALSGINVSSDNSTYASYDGALYDADLTTLIVVPAGKRGALTIAPGADVLNAKALDGCSLITDLTLPAQISFYTDFVASCSSLSNIEIGEGNDNYYSYDGALYSVDRTELLYVPKGRTGSLTVAEGTKAIAANVAENCAITELILPEGLLSIGARAFSETQLTSVQLPASLTYLGAFCFPDGCCEMEDDFYYVGNWLLYCDGFMYETVKLREGTVGIAEQGISFYAQILILNRDLKYINDSAFYWAEFDNIFYEGSSEEWKNVTIGENKNEAIINADICFYSETQPSGNGSFWHYSNGKPVKW